jgi:hypothetical protein
MYRPVTAVVSHFDSISTMAAMAAGSTLYSAATLLSAASISALLVDGTLAPDVSSLDMIYLSPVWNDGF